MGGWLDTDIPDAHKFAHPPMNNNNMDMASKVNRLLVEESNGICLDLLDLFFYLLVNSKSDDIHKTVIFQRITLWTEIFFFVLTDLYLQNIFVSRCSWEMLDFLICRNIFY